MARAGLSVAVYEGKDSPGGGCRTEQLTLPGFLHDVCSAVHPLLAVSSFFKTVDLAHYGVRLRHPPVVLAHPLEGGRAAAVLRSVDETAEGLGVDGSAYKRLMGPFVQDFERIVPVLLAPMRSLPKRPLPVARFALRGLLPASALAHRFRSDEARALMAGTAAHSMRPLASPLTGSFALLFTMMAHGAGWPLVEGGSAGLIRALIEELESCGGQVSTDRWVTDLADVVAQKATLLDVTPRQLLSIAGDRLPGGYRRALKGFVYGPGIFKVDWALSGPVPWKAAACQQAGTVHVGGTFEEVARSEADVAGGRHPDRPFCIVAQPGVTDPTRAPEGRHTLWAYCHVPSGSWLDMTDRIEAQIERFAPGFRDLILARATRSAQEVERHNPDYVGGDIGAGAATLRQTLFRPTISWNPYRTALDGVYLCSASTPPGGGVHGMCGHWAAWTALSDLRRTRKTRR